MRAAGRIACSVGGSARKGSATASPTHRWAARTLCVLGALALALTFAPAAGAHSPLPMRFVVTKMHLNHGHVWPRRLHLAARAAHSHRARAAIVGGSPISITKAPWQVVVIAVVSQEEALICGGSILNETEVLTAAHCVFNPNTSQQFAPTKIVIGAGASNINVEPEQVTLGEEVRVHPYFVYNPAAQTAVPDDVAVLKLAQPLSFNPGVQAISPVPAGSLLKEGASLNLTGFGAENPLTGELNGELNSIGMTLGFSGQCGGATDALFLCASSPRGSDCFGDSGSGLTVPGPPAMLAGVTDTVQIIAGKACVDGAIGGYANLAAPEIGDFVFKHEAAPPRAPEGEITPSIDGVPVVGNTLSCQPGTWANTPTSFDYAFISSTNGQVLQDGPSSTYELTPADIGRAILCEEFAGNEGGTGIGRSQAETPVTPTVREEEAARKKHEEELAAKKKAQEEETAARKKHEEELAAAKRAQEEEIAARKRIEAAAAKEAQEAAAAKQKQQEAQGPSNSAVQGVAGFQMSVAPRVPDAKLASTALEASSSGVVTIKVSCPAGETSCAGTVTLRTIGAVSATAGKKGAVLTLATASFKVAGGKVKTVTLHLSSAARKLLGRAHVLHARSTIIAHDPAGATHTTQTTVTIRAPKTGHSSG
jgi:hypothetical protein